MRPMAAGFRPVNRRKVNARSGTPVPVPSFVSRSIYPKQEILMRSKLAISALVVASLLGATTIASAQTQPAPGASSEGNVGPGATDSKMKAGKMKSSKMKSGTTTGMNAGSRKGDSAGKNNDSK